jgi:hypothetical protein
MADLTHVPFRVTRVSAHGSTYEICEIAHTYRSSEATTFEVDASAVSAKHLETAGQTAVTVTFDGTAAEISPEGTSRTYYGKTVSIPATSASGNYVIVVRHAGECGGFKSDR